MRFRVGGSQSRSVQKPGVLEGPRTAPAPLAAGPAEDSQEPRRSSPAYVALQNGQSCLLLAAMGLSCF